MGLIGLFTLPIKFLIRKITLRHTKILIETYFLPVVIPKEVYTHSTLKIPILNQILGSYGARRRRKEV